MPMPTPNGGATDVNDDGDFQLVRKQYIAKVDANGGEGSVVATINTATVDRDDEVVLPSGANLAHYRKNPVVLFSHRYADFPIGKAAWIKRSGETIIAKTIFAPTEEGQQVMSLFAGGFLNAFSIGFDPERKFASSPTPDELKQNSSWANARTIFRRWELLEYSVVSVPANPEALARSYIKGDVHLCQKLRDVLEIASKAAPKVQAVRPAAKEFRRVQAVESVGKQMRLEAMAAAAEKVAKRVYHGSVN